MSSRVGNRLVAIGAVGSFFALATVLLLADRASRIVWHARVAVVNAGRRFERTYDIDVIDRSDFPGTFDQIGHAALWGCGMVIVGMALRRHIPVLITALFMGGASLAFEAAQPLLSSTRTLQPSDAIGNLVGIAVASVALSTFLWVRRGLRVTPGEM